METIGPYRLTEMLSLRPAGRVWRAVDQYGTPVTIAVLETADSERAHLFRAAVTGPLQGHLVNADLNGPRPWAALAEDGGPGALQIFARMAGGHPGQPPQGVPPVDDMPTVLGTAPPQQYAPAHPSPHQPVAPDAAWGPPGAQQTPPQEHEPAGSGSAASQNAPPGYDPTPPQAVPPADAPPGYGPHLFDSAPHSAPPGYDPNAHDPNAYGPNAYDPNAYDPNAYDPNAYDPNAYGTAPPQSGPPVYGPAGYGPGPYGAPPQSGPPAYGAPPPQSAPPAYGPAGYNPAPQSPPPGYDPAGYNPAPQSPPPGYDPAGYNPASQSPPPGYDPSLYGSFGAPAPQSGPPAYGPGPAESPGWPQPPAAPPRKRRGLLVAGVILLVLVLVGAGVVTTWALTKSDDSKPVDRPTAAPSKTAKPPASPNPGANPPAVSDRAGKEPPIAGSWPTAWPTFTAADPTKQQEKLAGLGFSFRVPADWECTKIDQSGRYAKWECTEKTSAAAPAGGELIVRECSEPCDSQRKIQMRRAENAWSLQWTRADGHSAYAETDELPGKSGKRYGLVAVRYWHSKEGGPLDRQVVFRMTAPPSGKAALQKILNEVRAGTP